MCYSFTHYCLEQSLVNAKDSPITIPHKKYHKYSIKQHSQSTILQTKYKNNCYFKLFMKFIQLKRTINESIFSIISIRNHYIVLIIIINLQNKICSGSGFYINVFQAHYFPVVIYIHWTSYKCY